MYSRYPNYRFGGGIKIPENYSGNAFSAPSEAVEQGALDGEMDIAGEPEVSSAPASPSTEESVSAALTRQRRRLPFGFDFNLGRLFSGGFGFEELLLIALILLVSQGESGEDLILFLALLLFVG